MPEGDSYANAAASMRPVLVGETVTGLDGTSPAIRRHATRILGHAVADVRTHGKHLLIDLEAGWSIHVHLGMNGVVRVAVGGVARTHGEHVTRAGPDRLVLATQRGIVRVRAAPTIEVDRTGLLDAHVVGALGPDLLAEEVDTPGLARRIGRAGADRVIADVLLDQRVLAGIGNVYKCEVLFLAGVHPATPTGALAADVHRVLAERARALLRANRGRGRRVTTGDPRRPLWVYGRAGLPCRRCGTIVAEAWMGTPTPRITYWCPTCQPPVPPDQPSTPGQPPASG